MFIRQETIINPTSVRLTVYKNENVLLLILTWKLECCFAMRIVSNIFFPEYVNI